MEKKFKRVLVLFLALVMLFGLLPAVSAPVLAENVVSRIEVTGLVEPSVGANAVVGDIVIIGPEGVDDKIKIETDSTYWMRKVEGVLEFLPSNEAFDINYEHWIQIGFKANEGVTFADDLTGSINGSEVAEENIHRESDWVVLWMKFVLTLPHPDDYFTVEFKPGYGGSGEMSNVRVATSYSWPLPVCTFNPPMGQQFYKWRLNDDYDNYRYDGEEVTLEADSTLTAIWRELIHLVEITGVTPPKNGNQPTTDGIELSAINPEGGALIGCIFWEVRKGANFIKMDESKDFFETGKQYKITLDLQPFPSYGFPKNFTAKVNGMPATDAYGISEIGRVYMEFPILYEYEVSFNPNGGEGTMDSVVVENGSLYELPTNGFMAPVGKKFKSWDVEGTEKQPGDKFTVTKDTEVKALWEDLKFTVTYQDEDGNVVGTPQTVIYGNDAVPEAIPPKAGFVGKWDHDGKNITEDKIIKPVYVELKMTKKPFAWIQGSGEDAEFTSNAEFSDFVGVKVDDKDLDPSNYDVKEGSIIVTLKAAYLKTLAPGKHKVEIISKSGKAVGHITIKAAPPKANPVSMPKTGDSGDVLFWIEIALLSATGLVLTYLEKKRRRKNNS